uniref:Uncharacterized protein n=1 Tax=Arundo donax TaxID=35708 RepID=A0A0A9DL82_ARUDO
MPTCGLYHTWSRISSNTLRAESQRRAATRSWRASRTVRGRRRRVPLPGLRVSRTALVASRRRMTESAFRDAIFRFTSSFRRLSASSSSASASASASFPRSILSSPKARGDSRAAQTAGGSAWLAG